MSPLQLTNSIQLLPPLPQERPSRPFLLNSQPLPPVQRNIHPKIPLTFAPHSPRHWNIQARVGGLLGGANLTLLRSRSKMELALGTEGRGKPQYFKPLHSIPMPARVEAGTPAGHSLALFSEGHVARNEIDRTLALAADPGAAADVHRFHLSMKCKQDLFARMRDLDIAWNDWLAGAEEIDSRLRASNITSRIYPFLPQPLPRGLDVYHIDESGSNDRRFWAHLNHLDGVAPIPIPPRRHDPPLARNPPLHRPELHAEEPHDVRCLYCDTGHVAQLCPRPHVLCQHSTCCLVPIHHPGFGSPCTTRVIYLPRPEPYNQVDPRHLRITHESVGEGKTPLA
ncbi:hypothetical protein EDB87DRAFT_1660244 [Lactarius vividus]|nr:hypothetical protein EDB87DRAFT_1660244 [Lactarius vividus]